jgi:predicted RND superfamily exporter protein
VTFCLKDHRGGSIRTAVQRLKEFISDNPLKQGSYLRAGGVIGVTAAVNEEILSGQIESVVLALLWLVICCAVAYRSTRAGIFFMARKGIGMTLSTLPVAALGIGLGVEYVFYVVDGIREELHHHNDLKRATQQSLRAAGKGVLLTSLTLTAVLCLWSSQRLQAGTGLSMALAIQCLVHHCLR